MPSDGRGTKPRYPVPPLACDAHCHVFGPADRSGSFSFNIKGIHHYDLGTLMDQMGVAVRTGHHCCQPLMARFGITGTVRASFALYNTMNDVTALIEATDKAAGMLR